MMSSVICCVCFVPRAHRPARRDCAVVSRVPAHIGSAIEADSTVDIRTEPLNGARSRAPHDVVSIAGFCFWCRPDRG